MANDISISDKLIFYFVDHRGKWVLTSSILQLVAICEMGFHYQDKVSPFSYATNIASKMQVSYLCSRLFGIFSLNFIIFQYQAYSCSMDLFQHFIFWEIIFLCWALVAGYWYTIICWFMSPHFDTQISQVEVRQRHII